MGNSYEQHRAKGIARSQKIAQDLGFPMKIVSQEISAENGYDLIWLFFTQTKAMLSHIEVYQHFYDQLRDKILLLSQYKGSLL